MKINGSEYLVLMPFKSEFSNTMVIGVYSETEQLGVEHYFMLSLLETFEELVLA